MSILSMNLSLLSIGPHFLNKNAVLPADKAVPLVKWWGVINQISLFVNQEVWMALSGIRVRLRELADEERAKIQTTRPF